jgi:hypothetical protein
MNNFDGSIVAVSVTQVKGVKKSNIPKTPSRICPSVGREALPIRQEHRNERKKE